MPSLPRPKLPPEAHTRLRRRVKHHYYRVMPDRARYRSAIWSVFWVVAGILVVQIIYPPTKTMPMAYWQGERRGNSDELALATEITKAFNDTSVQLIAGETTIEVPLGQFGAEPQTGSTVAELTDYPFWQRYVPLSILWPRHTDSTAVTYTNSVAQEACQRYARELSYPAINASVELVDGRLVASDESDGAIIDADALCRQIQEQPMTLGQSVSVYISMKRVEPEQSADDFAAVVEQATLALDRQIVLLHDGQSYMPEADQRATWLQLDSDDSGETLLAINDKAVREYLRQLNQQIGHPAGQTNVRIVNGVEQSRDVGESGSEINYELASELIGEQLLGRTMLQPIALTLREVQPTVIYNNRYTATQEGLQAYVSDAAHKYNAHISIQQLDGPGWRAAAREHESIPSASTYKLYVAMRLFEDMKNGHLTWNDRILDTTVTVCFDRMIIASTNDCSVEWLRQFGRNEVNQYLHDRGFSSGTTFTHPRATHSTAADLTSYMVRLARGELFDDVYKQRLMSALNTQRYRYGIPTGSQGKVYDKVGYLWDYVHDTAIVEHPRGRYVITVMTKGQGYARIAEITREVERLMYP